MIYEVCTLFVFIEVPIDICNNLCIHLNSYLKHIFIIIIINRNIEL